MIPTQLIFATNNAHKVEEIKAVVPDGLLVRSLAEAGISKDIPEPFDTLEANSLEKARVIYALTGLDCFSEDTGLEVDALGGEPGVRSARYAGEGRSSNDNTALLLERMNGQQDRSAQFHTVITLIWKGATHRFEGICRGRIIHAPSGNQGFGYDPVFIPDGGDRTFAEMSLLEKSRYSHRGKATALLVQFLRGHAGNDK
jgi:XTP/dITP diphosphohydrolase